MALRNYESIPRPFVIEPPPEIKTEYEHGEELFFNLILIGKAIAYFPYFVVAFRELGFIGIGRGRKKYELKEITAINEQNKKEEQIYLSCDELIKNTDLAISGLDFREAPTENNIFTIDFETMTRLKYEKRFVQTLEFHVLMRNLLRRLSSLYYFHHDCELSLDFNSIIKKAEDVKIVADGSYWADWERYSSRQGKRMNLGGIVGRVEYRGEWHEFWSLLKLGELVHVGKAATFGMGKYKIMDTDYLQHSQKVKTK
ncbi:CRISPR system precrRNA processing endoribonuclease RAMP protein Cas6 [Phosphitispora sp. TUW77]|uniref:CRISPR system precrRNA processing endoribonuclease RAMP protein Cas6 n=1 Tax=Phosphitispora sp. TUW77 TaxID=3152361 RepID=UPI003AB84560